MLTLFQERFPSLIFTPWFQGVFPTPLPKTDLSFLGTSDTSCEHQIPVPVWVPYRFAPWGQRVPLICLLWTPSRVWLRRKKGREEKTRSMNLFLLLSMWTSEGPLWGEKFSTHFSNLEQTKIIMDVEGTEDSKVLFFPITSELASETRSRSVPTAAL